MKWNPFTNAAAELLYIGAVVLFMRFIESRRQDTPDTLLDGMAAISLFVFSAALMAFLFFYHPVLKLFENQPAEAVTYFLKTLAIFGFLMIALLTLASLQGV